MNASVLVVSNDAVLRALLLRVVGRLDGLTVAGAVDEAAAVAAVRRERPAMAVIDADGPRADALLAKLSLVGEGTLVAVSATAWPGTAEAENLLMAGASAVLPKPSGRSSVTLAGDLAAVYAACIHDIHRSRKGAPA